MDYLILTSLAFIFLYISYLRSEVEHWKEQCGMLNKRKEIMESYIRNTIR